MATIALIILVIYLINKLTKPLTRIYAKQNFGRQSLYEKLLQDERWQDKRRAILQRDKYCCTKCGSEINLQVHHKYYSKYPDGKMVDPWDYPNDALTTLCNNCHKEIHKYKKIKIYYRSRDLKYN